MKRKLLILLLGTALALGVTGCTKDKAPNVTPTPSPAGGQQGRTITGYTGRSGESWDGGVHGDAGEDMGGAGGLYDAGDGQDMTGRSGVTPGEIGRDVGDGLGDVARGIGDAARDVTDGVGQAIDDIGRGVQNAVR